MALMKELFVQLVLDGFELAWGRDTALPIGVARSRGGGSSGAEKSELSNVDSEMHSSK